MRKILLLFALICIQWSFQAWGQQTPISVNTTGITIADEFYNNALLSEICQDLTKKTGVKIDADPTLLSKYRIVIGFRKSKQKLALVMR
jgi:hypothetical protein